MSNKKYLSDYSLEQTIGPRGRVVSEYRYIGSRYSVSPGGLSAGRVKASSVLLAAAVAVFIAAMIPSSSSMRRFYILLPYAFAAVPLFFACRGAAVFLLSGPEYTRMEKDRISALPGGSLVSAVFILLALAGSVVTGIVSSGFYRPGDWVFLTLSILLAAVLFCVFSFTRKLSFTEVSGEGKHV